MYIQKLFIVSLSVFLPIKGMILSTLFLVLADMVLGAWAAYKRGEAITSAGFRRTVSKLIIFQVAIITGFICETYLIGGIFPISKLCAGVIGLVEIKSILESCNVIYGGNLFKGIIEKLGSINDKK